MFTQQKKSVTICSKNSHTKLIKTDYSLTHGLYSFASFFLVAFGLGPYDERFPRCVGGLKQDWFLVLYLRLLRQIFEKFWKRTEFSKTDEYDKLFRAHTLVSKKWNSTTQRLTKILRIGTKIRFHRAHFFVVPKCSLPEVTSREIWRNFSINFSHSILWHQYHVFAINFCIIYH